MKDKRYTEDDIWDMLRRAYPQKSEEEIDDMVQDTLAQYLKEQKDREKDGVS